MARRTAPRVLLTGFEPFAGETINPTAQLLESFDGLRIAGHRVRTTVLPVAFADAITALAHGIDAASPTLVLALGQAGGRARLALERVALNLIDARIADNAGAQPIDTPVIAGAPDAYFSTLPLKAMRRALHEAGIPAELSLSAGTYVCNAVFFALRHLIATRWPNLRGGFLHVPYLPSQAARHPGAPSLALDTLRAGVRVALETAIVTQVDVHEVGGVES